MDKIAVLIPCYNESKTITWKNRQDFEISCHQARNKKGELYKAQKDKE